MYLFKNKNGNKLLLKTSSENLKILEKTFTYLSKLMNNIENNINNIKNDDNKKSLLEEFNNNDLIINKEISFKNKTQFDSLNIIITNKEQNLLETPKEENNEIDLDFDNLEDFNNLEDLVEYINKEQPDMLNLMKLDELDNINENNLESTSNNINTTTIDSINENDLINAINSK